jgi:hypothetical protein
MDETNSYSDPDRDAEDGLRLTALDQMVSDEQSQFLKAALPYLGSRQQQILSVYTKARELSNAMSLFASSGNEVRIQSQETDPLEMLKDIRRFCYGKSRGILDQAINFMTMAQLSELLNSEENKP